MTATMSATIIDSAIFREIFSTEEMRRVSKPIEKFLNVKK